MADEDQSEETPEGTYQEEEGKPPGVVISAEQKQKVVAAAQQDMYRLGEDVWQEFYAEGSKRPSYFLVAAAGTPMAKAQLEALGVEVQSAKVEPPPTVDESESEEEESEGESEEEPEGDSEQAVDQYSSMGIAQLRALIDERNANRDEEDHISKAGSKADLAARLREDDAAQNQE